MTGYLVLEDGRVFKGMGHGHQGIAFGEAVFNTSMTGYQEILTDPSYHGQIINMTYPLIGNYGVNQADCESRSLFCKGFVVRELCLYPSNQRSEGNLEDYLSCNQVIALSQVDTRAVTRHIRLAGAMRAVIAHGDYSEEELVEQAKKSSSLVGKDLVSEVSCQKNYTFTQKCDWGSVAAKMSGKYGAGEGAKKFKVVVYDFGVKLNILRFLVTCNCEVEVVPATTSALDVLALNPDGILLSNGPGDPEGADFAVREIRQLIGEKPIFGICLGHQLLALAFGGKTRKLKFGHRGANQPVQDLATGKIEITAQNHGFCVDFASLQGTGVEVSHLNLNDNTVEGLRHLDKLAFSVQYHPEASAGPHDAEYLFGRFMELMHSHAEKK